MSDNNTSFAALLAPEQILCDLGQERLDQTIHRLVVRIAEIERSIDIENAYSLVLNREGCGVTIIQPGVAVVHVRTEGLKQLRIAMASSLKGFVCSQEQMEYECLGAEFGPVNIAVLMMAPPDDTASYLRAVAALTTICKQDGFVEQIMKLDHPQRVWESFEKSGARLPEFVEAQHIMRTDFSCLYTSDSLCIAIDLFCREGIGEYPVIDCDGELIGIVSEDELIRLCLPEYITWMEDLSPILNFEPFAQVLRHERNMPVMEIMKFDEHYATVDESTPAIQVAKIMMRRDVRQVFVLRDKKLMGIISIQDFIKKVLRA